MNMCLTWQITLEMWATSTMGIRNVNLRRSQVEKERTPPPGAQVTPTLMSQNKSSAELQLIHSAN